MIVTLSNCCETEICILTRTELETQLTAARFTLEAVWSHEKRWLCGTPPWMSSQELALGPRRNTYHRKYPAIFCSLPFFLSHLTISIQVPGLYVMLAEGEHAGIEVCDLMVKSTVTNKQARVVRMEDEDFEGRGNSFRGSHHFLLTHLRFSRA
jgi:hypothetical protein